MWIRAVAGATCFIYGRWQPGEVFGDWLPVFGSEDGYCAEMKVFRGGSGTWGAGNGYFCSELGCRKGGNRVATQPVLL